MQLLIDRYLETAEPVGSKAVAEALRERGISLSPASVRSTLAALARLGLVEQPHTSAGRIPTREGLSLYVRHLMQVKSLSPDENFALRSRPGNQTGDLISVLRETSRLLSQLSHYAALVVIPQTDDVIVDAPWGVMDQRELLSMDQLRHRLAILQEKARLMELLGDLHEAGKAEVVALQDCSMVTAPYAEGPTILGCVGVMGPRRMDYSRAVPMVESAARYIGDWLTRQ